MSLGGDSPRDAPSLPPPPAALPLPYPASPLPTPPVPPTTPPGEDILGIAAEGQERGNLINECGPLPVSLAPRRLPEAPAVRDFKWQDIDTRRAKHLGLCERACVCERQSVCVEERNTEEKICAQLSVHAFV